MGDTPGICSQDWATLGGSSAGVTVSPRGSWRCPAPWVLELAVMSKGAWAPVGTAADTRDPDQNPGAAYGTPKQLSQALHPGNPMWAPRGLSLHLFSWKSFAGGGPWRPEKPSDWRPLGRWESTENPVNVQGLQSKGTLSRRGQGPQNPSRVSFPQPYPRSPGAGSGHRGLHRVLRVPETGILVALMGQGLVHVASSSGER